MSGTSNIMDLYRIHINDNPDGAEIHNFFRMFDLAGVIVHNPNPRIEELEEEQRVRNINKAKNYIFQNSRL